MPRLYANCWLGCSSLLLLLLLLLVELRGTAALAALVNNALDFAKALSDAARGSYDEIVIAGDLRLTDDSFRGLPLPILVSSRILIRGIYEEAERWVVLDFNAAEVVGKVRLLTGAIITCTHVIITNFRVGPHFQAPGWELLLPSLPEDWGRSYVVMRDMGAIQSACLPTSLAQQSIGTVPKPQNPAYPNATWLFDIPNPDDCVPQTEQGADGPGPVVPYMRRCWPTRGVYITIVAYGLALDPASGKAVRTGYDMLGLNVSYLCERRMSTECITQLGPIGCWKAVVGVNATAPAPAAMNPDAAHSPLPAPPIAYAAEQGGDSGGDSDSAVVPAVVGGALGGVALIALVGITAWLVARRRRHRHSLSTGEAKEAAAAAAKDVEACRTPSLVALADPPSLPTSSDQTGVRSSALPLAPAPALGPGPAPAAPEPAPVSDPVVSPRSVSAKSLQHKPSSLAAFLGLGRPFSSQASARVPTLSAAGSRSRCSTAETALVSAAGDKASVTRTTKSDHCTAQGSAANESAAAADAAVSNGRLLQEQERGSTRSGGSEPTASAPLPPWSLDTAEEAVPVTALTPFVPGLVFGVTVQRPGQGDANASASAGGGGGIGGGGLILKGCAPGVVGFKPALGGASPGVAAAAAAAGSWTPTNTLQGLLAATAAEGGASAEAPTAAGAAGASGGAGARGDAGGGRPATSSHLLPSLDVAGALADMMQRVPPSQAFTDGGLATVGEGGGGGAGVALTTASGGLTQTEAPQCVELTRVALGKGAYGKVVEGMYGGRKVAVKLIAHPLLPLLAPEGGGGSSGLQPEGWQLKAFEQEVEVLGRCCHPNIVSLLAANLKPPRICLVLERMDTSLDRLLSKHRHAGTLLPMPAVMAIAIDVAKGLAFLHPTITHRDLKPGNILINQPDSDAPTAKLTDFGLSRLRSTVAPTQNPEVGTPAFMAPEVFDVQNYVITDKADMYAFGVILWQMLSGAVPWQGLDMMNIARAVTLGKARLPIWGVLEGPGSLAGGGRCDLRLKAVIQGCWEQDPQRRPAAAEVLKDLQLAREELSSGAAELFANARGASRSSGESREGLQGPAKLSLVAL